MDLTSWPSKWSVYFLLFPSFKRLLSDIFILHLSESFLFASLIVPLLIHTEIWLMCFNAKEFRLNSSSCGRTHPGVGRTFIGIVLLGNKIDSWSALLLWINMKEQGITCTNRINDARRCNLYGWSHDIIFGLFWFGAVDCDQGLWMLGKHSTTTNT